MKKSMLFLAGIGAVLSAGTLNGAERSNYLQMNGVLALENIDEDETARKFSGPIAIDFDDSLGLQLRLGHRYTATFGVEIMAEYLASFEADSVPALDDDLDVLNLGVNGKWICPINAKFIPYGIVGAGILNATEEIHYQGATSDTSDWGLGLRGGLGVDYILDNAFTLGLEGAYTSGFGSVDHIEYTTLSLGVGYHF